MKTKLYAILNAHAKRWWYHDMLRRQGKHQEARRSEREDILETVARLRQVIAGGGFLTVGRGGWTLHIGEWNRLTSRYHSIEDAIPQACLLLGIPVLDTTTVPDDRVHEMGDLPMPSAHPDQEPEDGYRAWDHAPFAVVVSQYVALGATVYNFDLDSHAGAEAERAADPLYIHWLEAREASDTDWLDPEEDYNDWLQDQLWDYESRYDDGPLP